MIEHLPASCLILVVEGIRLSSCQRARKLCPISAPAQFQTKKDVVTYFLSFTVFARFAFFQNDSSFLLYSPFQSLNYGGSPILPERTPSNYVGVPPNCCSPSWPHFRIERPGTNPAGKGPFSLQLTRALLSPICKLAALPDCWPRLHR